MAARPRLQTTDFDDDHEKAHRLIWMCATEFYEQWRSLIPPDQLYASLERKMNKMLEFEDPQMRQFTFDLAYQLNTMDGTLSVPAKEILGRFLKERRLGTHLKEFAERGSDDWDKYDKEYTQRKQQIDLTTAEPITPFAAEKPMLGVAERNQIGVMFVDEMLGGGTRYGESYGFLAPTGGGKTTLINQIGVEIARRGRVFVIFHYEQRLEGVNDFWVGPYAYAANILKDRIEAISSPDELDAEERKRFDAALESVGNRLIFYDFSGSSNSAGNGGVEEVESCLLDLTSRGIAVEGFAIDWFWLMMQRNLKLNDSDQETAVRTYAFDMLVALKALGGRYGCWSWINHQLQAAKGATPNQAVKWNDAAEMKSFAWVLDCCFGLNGFSGSGHAQLEISKGRNQKLQKRNVRLIGEKATFVGAEDDLVYNKQLNVHEKANERNVVPTDDSDSGPVRAQIDDLKGEPISDL